MITSLRSKNPTHISRFLFVVLLTALSLSYTAAQTGSVRGRIEDASTGEGLIGASILIQGTANGAVADLDGNFKLSDLHHGTYNLIISYVSYEQQIQRIEIKKDEIIE